MCSAPCGATLLPVAMRATLYPGTYQEPRASISEHLATTELGGITVENVETVRVGTG